jgi:hypothetical protein
MLLRVALNQTRLKTPGIGIDTKGVALGSKGLVLLPSLDRLVTFLSLYTSQRSLEDLLRSLTVELVRSKLGAREIVLTFAVDSSARLDAVADIARLAGGFTFTGTSRHFVQYRDAAAPFGYDIPEVAATDGSYALYHSAFTQDYATERTLSLGNLLLRMSLHPDPATRTLPGAKWITAEKGLGPAMIAYLTRSAVPADVGVAEWPPESSFDDAPVARYLFRLDEVPARMLPLFSSTPGLSVYQAVSATAAVELGFRHPVELRSCPVWAPGSMVFFRGSHTDRAGDPLVLSKLPALGPVASFARVEFKSEGVESLQAQPAGQGGGVSLALRLTPTTDPFRGVTATWIRPDELPLLRRIAYSLGAATLQRAKIAFTNRGAFLVLDSGIEAIPVGEMFREAGPNLYLPAGFDAIPAVSADVLLKSLGAPAGLSIFILRDARVIGIESKGFVPLETGLLEAQTWALLPAAELETILATSVPELQLESPGLRPLRDLDKPVEQNLLPPGEG